MKKPRKSRGAVVVEMAITLPIFFAFTFACVEFARMNVIRHTIDNAAYEAARRVIVPGSTAADAEAVVTRIMNTVGARGVNISVNPPVILLETPEVTVDVSVNCDENGFIAPIFFSGKQLTGRSTLRRETL
jgi:Flp pilus assembly protein TadG